jgi:sugar phosphate isomerase/epimerase
MSVTRRQFVFTLGTALSATLSPVSLMAAPRARITRLGAQLWTVRNLAARNLGDVLRRIAEIGYADVEFAGYHGVPPAAIRKMLKSSGLAAPSAHIRFEDLRDGIAPALSDARILGHRYLIFAWIPEEERTRDGFLRIAEALNRAGRITEPYGIKVGYHNYSYDFATSGSERMYDLILENTDPALVTMEMDVYWILAGGGDPIEYLKKYRNRYSLIHIKDMLGDSSHTMVDVGDGVVKWSAILGEAKRAGVKHFIVEHDEPVDPIKSLRRSYRFVHSLKME